MGITSLVALSLMFGLFACSDKSTNSTNGNDPPNIKNIWWRAQSFKSVTGDTITLAPNESYLVLFTDTLWGKTDSLCRNTYYATYQIRRNDSLSIDPIVTTKVGCRSSYTQYLGALQSAATFQISNDTLTIFQSGGTKRLILVKQ